MSTITREEERESAANLALDVADLLELDDEQVKLYGTWVCLRPEDMSHLLHLAEQGKECLDLKGRR